MGGLFSSTGNTNERKTSNDDSSADIRRDKHTQILTSSNKVAWLRGSIQVYLNISNRARDGKIEDILSCNSEGEILEAIINLSEINLLKYLTQNVQNFICNVTLNLWKKLIKLSAEKEFFEIYQELKELEKHYERRANEEFSKISKGSKVNLDFEYKNALKDISKLHNDISDGNVNEIKFFINKYPQLKLCRGLQDISALDKSIDDEQFEAYAFLRANDFYSDNNQTLQEKINKLGKEKKEEIRVEILKFTSNDPIALILTKCELDARCDVINFRDIREMLEILMNIREIKPVLEILAQSNVRIIFDYNNKYVEKVDPTADDYYLGQAHFEKGILYIGKGNSKAQRFGTFAHEATHFALYLIYENACLPYKAEDIKSKKIWEDIVENIRQIYGADPIGTDNIIKWVYDLYDPGYEHNAELIVRVNDLLAFYHGNPRKCAEVRRTYAQLFEFYRDRVMPDLNVKNVYKIIKLNNDFGLFNNIVSSKFQVQSSENFHLLEFKENVQKACESFKEETSRDLNRLNEINQKVQNFSHNNFLLHSDVPQMTLSKLFNEISQKSSNKLDVKVKNIFINFEKLLQNSFKKELEDILKSSDALRIIIYFDVNKKIEENFEFLFNIKASSKIFIVAPSNCDDTQKALNNFLKIEDSKIEIEGKVLKLIEKDITKTIEGSKCSSLNILKVYLKHSWLELTEASKGKVLKCKIKVCGESLKLSDLFVADAFPSAETLKILSSQGECEIKLKEPVKLDSFISRRVLIKNDTWPWLSAKTLEEFIEEVKTDKIVVISDLAGSGKTTLLQKIHEILDEKFQNFWISFVVLRDHIKLLKDSLQIGENFLDVVSEKIFKLNELERKIFELKYERNEVVILFDGFDEISPSCKKNSLQIFKLHRETEKSQIWVTTRTHLEHDIESALDLKAHAIIPLTEEEQIKFLIEFWRESCDDSNLRKKCAKLLVKQMTKVSKVFPNLIGIILQLRLLGERFKNELSEDFQEKIKNLNIFDVYEYLAQSSSKFKDPNAIQNVFNTHTTIYEVFALKSIVGYKFPHLFGRTSMLEDFGHDKDALEEFTKGGIIRYDKDGRFYFLHRTIAEFFISRFIKNRIKSFKLGWRYEKDFLKLLFEILSDNNFSVVKEFLDNSFINFEEEIAQGEYKNFQKSLVKFVSSFFNVLSQGLSVTSLFVLKCIKMESDETFKKLMKSSEGVSKYYGSYFEFCVEQTKDLKLLEKFLDEIFSTFADDSELFDLLMQQNDNRETVFHRIAQKEKFETFKKFWYKVEERNFEYEKVLKFFSSRDEKGKFFFSFNNEENLIFFSCIFDFKNFFDKNSWKVTKILRPNSGTKDGRKFFNENELKMENFVEDEKTFKKVSEFTRKIFDSDYLMVKLKEFDKNCVKKIFFEAAVKSLAAVFELALNENQNLKNEKIFDFSLKKDIWSQSLLRATAERKFCEIFKLIFEKAYFKILTFKEFAFDRNMIFHHLAKQGNLEMIKIFVTRARIELSDEEFKNYIKIKTIAKQNALMISACWENFEVFCFLFDEVYLKILRFKEFAYEVDEGLGENVLHYLVKKGNIETLKYFLDRAPRDELKKFLKIKTKRYERNIFHLATRNGYETIDVLFEFVQEFFTKEEMKEIATQRDAYGHLPHEQFDARSLYKKIKGLTGSSFFNFIGNGPSTHV